MYWDFVWFHGICIHHVNLTFVLATNKFKKDYRHKVKQTNRSPSFLEDKKTSVMREFTILQCNLEQEWGSPKGRWAGNSYIFANSIALFPMAFGKNFISFGLQSKRPTNICMELCHSHLLVTVSPLVPCISFSVKTTLFTFPGFDAGVRQKYVEFSFFLHKCKLNKAMYSGTPPFIFRCNPYNFSPIDPYIHPSIYPIHVQMFLVLFKQKEQTGVADENRQYRRINLSATFRCRSKGLQCPPPPLHRTLAKNSRLTKSKRVFSLGIAQVFALFSPNNSFSFILC